MRTPFFVRIILYPGYNIYESDITVVLLETDYDGIHLWTTKTDSVKRGVKTIII